MRKGYSLNKEAIKPKRRKFNILTLCFVAFAVYFIFTLCDQQVQINKYNSQINMYEADIKNKTQLIAYYGDQKNNVETDEYIENVARETLGYVKPYEKIFVDANK